MYANTGPDMCAASAVETECESTDYRNTRCTFDTSLQRGASARLYECLHRIQFHTRREEQSMFEAVFRITALVNSDGQGQRVFRVSEREAPANYADFLSGLATRCQQEVSTMLRAGHGLTVALRLDLPPTGVERASA